MEIIEWIVWGIFALLTISALPVWLDMKGSYKLGEWYDTNKVLMLKSLPKIFCIQAIIIVLFLFININKLHLLWIYPILCFGIIWRVKKKLITR